MNAFIDHSHRQYTLAQVAPDIIESAHTQRYAAQVPQCIVDKPLINSVHSAFNRQIGVESTECTACHRRNTDIKNPDVSNMTGAPAEQAGTMRFPAYAKILMTASRNDTDTTITKQTDQ